MGNYCYKGKPIQESTIYSKAKVGYYRNRRNPSFNQVQPDNYNASKEEFNQSQSFAKDKYVSTQNSQLNSVTDIMTSKQQSHSVLSNSESPLSKRAKSPKLKPDLKKIQSLRLDLSKIKPGEEVPKLINQSQTKDQIPDQLKDQSTQDEQKYQEKERSKSVSPLKSRKKQIRTSSKKQL